MHNLNSRTDNPFSKLGFILSKLLLSLFLSSFVLGLFITAITSGKYEIWSTKLTLKREGCSLLRQNGITTHGIPDEDRCTVNVYFRAYKFGNGGVIYFEDREINFADNQMIAYETLDDQPLAPSQRNSMLMLAASLFVMLIMLVWLWAI